MSEAQKYEGYGWIKVKREQPIVVGDKKFVSEDHHVSETTFLIEEVRTLAARIDALNKSLRSLRQQDEQRRTYDARRASHDLDHVGYHEDEFER